MALHAGLVGGALFLAIAGCATPPSRVVDDVSRLNPIAVERVVEPESVDEVQRLVRFHPGPISIGGARHSMGGQIATEQALALDMRRLDRVLELSVEGRTIKVEAGITWQKVQQAIDPHDLAVKIMQSYANFTVGGSLSVDAHGRYVNRGPLIQSVRAIEIVLADGSLVEASPTRNAEIFHGAIGGYGALGVIVTATLELEPNEKLELVVKRLRFADYPEYFRTHIRGSRTAVFHNADLYPPRYRSVEAITWSRTDEDLTVKDRLQPAGGQYWSSRLALVSLSRMPGSKPLRQHLIDPLRHRTGAVVWRNYEASYDAAELEPFSRRRATPVLQEYFVPVARLEDFVPVMAEIFRRYRVNVLNVSIRHATPDPGTLMAWAREECFALVIYYEQGVEPHERTAVGLWTRELIDAALAVNGSYYLPYGVHARDEQFHAAYPRARELFALKAKLDPSYKFRNKLWDRYLPPPSADPDGGEAAIRERLAARPGYRRDLNQTYLTLPEWYIVYSSDENGEFLRDQLPSRFPYFRSIGQFWSIYRHAAGATRDTGSPNWGYHVAIDVIGVSFTVEYVARGAYGNTIGRLTEAISLGGSAEKRGADEWFMADVARDYAAFIHHTPSYEYPFGTKLRELWSRPDRDRSWGVRSVERRFALSTDLAVKAAWGGLIDAATVAAYDPQALEIEAWVQAPDGVPVGAYPGVRTLEALAPGAWLVSIPRYENFKHAVRALLQHDVRFVEIAGNREILLTVIAPRSWDGARIWGEPMHEWPILTEPERKRVAFTVAVDRLGDVLAGLAHDGVELDHVYDY